MQQYSQYRDAIDLILHQSVHTYKPKNAKHQDTVVKDTNKKGAVAIVKEKDHLNWGHGIIVQSKQSVVELAGKGYTHWTPNAFNYLEYSDKKRKIVSKHTIDNLQQVNTFIVDIDAKLNTLDEIIIRCEEVGIGYPTLILSTDKGYHVYFVLDTPYFMSTADGSYTHAIVSKIAENINLALFDANIIGIDKGCNHFGYFRLPNTTNVAYFMPENMVTIDHMMDWSMSQSNDRVTSDQFGKTLYNKKSQGTGDYYEAVIDAMQNVVVSEHRNQAVLTMALAFYAQGSSEETASKVCKRWNQSFERPLSSKRVEICVRSAFSRRYRAPKKEYIEQVLAEEGAEMPAYVPGRFFKHAKPREERTYSHMSEWETDIINYLESLPEENQTDNGYVEMTQAELCQKIGIPKRTLIKLLKKSNKLKVMVQGKGRAAKTRIATITMRIQAVLKAKKQAVHTLFFTITSNMPRLKQAVRTYFKAKYYKITDVSGREIRPIFLN